MAENCGAAYVTRTRDPIITNYRHPRQTAVFQPNCAGISPICAVFVRVMVRVRGTMVLRKKGEPVLPTDPPNHPARYRRMIDRKLCSIEWCSKPACPGGLCLAHMRRMGLYGDPLGGCAIAGEPQAFLEFVVKAPPDTCVIWPFATDRLGYGQVSVEGRRKPAHRAAWELFHRRPMADNMDACHEPLKCHNRSCVNPRHIREATRAENMADTVLDGTATRGQNSAAVKLSEQQVRAIRADKRVQREIAATYGVSRDTVRSIKCGRRWAWLT